MRAYALVSALAASLMATTAFAAAPVGPVSHINVTIGSWLAQKHVDRFDARDFDYMKVQLRAAVEQELAKSGRLTDSGGRLDLVIEDATANKPTLQEMKYYPTLSHKSFYTGGAEITGTYTAPDGTKTPLSYELSEYNIRNARYVTTFRDVNRAFTGFAEALVLGKADEVLSPRLATTYRPGNYGAYSNR